MLAVKEYQHFYQGLADLFSDNFKIHCAALKVGDVLIATHVGVIDDTTFYYLMPANEGDDWKKYSPGRLLLLEILKWSIDNKLKFFDFTVGGEAYKKDWCNIETKLFEYVVPNSWIGISFRYAQKHKNKIKLLIKY